MTACERCKGACCESIFIPLKYKDEDAQRWLGFHGQEVETGISFDCKCSKLKNGKCSIYESRPNVCKEYEPGSDACLNTILKRRNYIAEEIFGLIK